MVPKTTRYLSCSSPWCAIGQWLGAGAGTLTSAVHLQEQDNSQLFNECLQLKSVSLAQSIFFNHADQHDEKKVPCEHSFTGFYPGGGQRARSQGFLVAVSFGLTANQVNHLSKRGNRIANEWAPGWRGARGGGGGPGGAGEGACKG